MNVRSERRIIVRGGFDPASAASGDAEKTVTVKPEEVKDVPTEVVIGAPQVCTKCMSVLAGVIAAAAVRYGGPGHNWLASIGVGFMVGATTAAVIHYGFNGQEK